MLDGLTAQARTGDLIKIFALLISVIGVISALLLSTYRRRPEIGIMRAMGASKGFVTLVFVIQGLLIGLLAASSEQRLPGLRSRHFHRPARSLLAVCQSILHRARSWPRSD